MPLPSTHWFRLPRMRHHPSNPLDAARQPGASGEPQLVSGRHRSDRHCLVRVRPRTAASRSARTSFLNVACRHHYDRRSGRSILGAAQPTHAAVPVVELCCLIAQDPPRSDEPKSFSRYGACSRGSNDPWPHNRQQRSRWQPTSRRPRAAWPARQAPSFQSVPPYDQEPPHWSRRWSRSE
jgi:hypothetical protein